jgi:hypothetical protein
VAEAIKNKTFAPTIKSLVGLIARIKLKSLLICFFLTIFVSGMYSNYCALDNTYRTGWFIKDPPSVWKVNKNNEVFKDELRVSVSSIIKAFLLTTMDCVGTVGNSFGLGMGAFLVSILGQLNYLHASLICILFFKMIF